MNILYVLSGLMAVGLLIYLLAALLKPEWFG
jgi:K+-transporting ATPase KdpF subunit